MASYEKLAGEGPAVNFEYISSCLKKLECQVKEYQKISSQHHESLVLDIEKSCENLKSLFSVSSVPNSDKQKLLIYNNQFKGLYETYLKIRENHEENCKNSNQSSLFSSGLLKERDSLALQDYEELKIQEREAKIKEINLVHKDMVMMNEMAKDTAKLVAEQGKMINNVENNVEIAVKESDRANKELIVADEHSRKHRQKKIIFLLILFAILLGIAAYIYFKKLDWFKSLFS